MAGDASSAAPARRRTYGAVKPPLGVLTYSPHPQGGLSLGSGRGESRSSAGSKILETKNHNPAAEERQTGPGSRASLGPIVNARRRGREPEPARRWSDKSPRRR